MDRRQTTTVVSRLLRQSILELCKASVPQQRGLEIDGIVCISICDEDDQQIVVRVHERLGGSVTTVRDATSSSPCQPLTPPPPPHVTATKGADALAEAGVAYRLGHHGYPALEAVPEGSVPIGVGGFVENDVLSGNGAVAGDDGPEAEERLSAAAPPVMVQSTTTPIFQRKRPLAGALSQRSLKKRPKVSMYRDRQDVIGEIMVKSTAEHALAENSMPEIDLYERIEAAQEAVIGTGDVPSDPPSQPPNLLPIKTELGSSDVETGLDDAPDDPTLQNASSTSCSLDPDNVQRCTMAKYLGNASLDTALFQDLRCEHCKLLLATFEDLKTHNRVHHKAYTCGYCWRSFFVLKNYKQHLRSHQRLRSPRYDGGSVLPQDLTPGSSPATLRQRRCGVCAEVFRSFSLVLEHLRGAHEFSRCFSCLTCDVFYPSREAFIRHRLSAHHDVHQCRCDNCEVYFTYVEYKHHEKECHQSPLDAVTTSVAAGTLATSASGPAAKLAEKRRRRRRCGVCLMVFHPFSLTSVVHHLRESHRSDIVLTCLTCEQYYPSRATFVEHRSAAHREINQCRCEICDVYFTYTEYKHHEKECVSGSIREDQGLVTAGDPDTWQKRPSVTSLAGSADEGSCDSHRAVALRLEPGKLLLGQILESEHSLKEQRLALNKVQEQHPEDDPALRAPVATRDQTEAAADAEVGVRRGAVKTDDVMAVGGLVVVSHGDKLNDDIPREGVLPLSARHSGALGGHTRDRPNEHDCSYGNEEEQQTDDGNDDGDSEISLGGTAESLNAAYAAAAAAAEATATGTEGETANPNDANGGTSISSTRVIQENVTSPLCRGPFRCQTCFVVLEQFEDFERHCYDDHFRYVCTFCAQSFANRRNLQRHIRKHVGDMPYVCDECGQRFYRDDNLRRHKLKHVTCIQFICAYCTFPCEQKEKLVSHLVEGHAIDALKITEQELVKHVVLADTPGEQGPSQVS